MLITGLLAARSASADRVFPQIQPCYILPIKRRKGMQYGFFHGDTNVPEDQVNVRRVELHKTPVMTVTDMRCAIKVQTRKP